MIESILQEGMRSIENVNEFANQISRLKESLEDLKVENRSYYQLLEDRIDLMSQINQIEESLEESERIVKKHVETLESTIE